MNIALSGDARTIIAHSLQKWRGLLPENLKKHNVDYNHLGDVCSKNWERTRWGYESVNIDSTTCSLCAAYYDDDYLDNENEDGERKEPCRRCVWTILVSRSVTHSGNDISAAVRARDVGQANVPGELLAEPVETLTVTTEEAGPGRLHLVFRWERTRLALELTRPGVPPDLGSATSPAANAAPQGRHR